MRLEPTYKGTLALLQQRTLGHCLYAQRGRAIYGNCNDNSLGAAGADEPDCTELTEFSTVHSLYCRENSLLQTRPGEKRTVSSKTELSGKTAKSWAKYRCAESRHKTEECSPHECEPSTRPYVSAAAEREQRHLLAVAVAAPAHRPDRDQRPPDLNVPVYIFSAIYSSSLDSTTVSSTGDGPCLCFCCPATMLPLLLGYWAALFFQGAAPKNQLARERDKFPADPSDFFQVFHTTGFGCFLWV